MKKFITIVLAVLMIAATTVTAFAETQSTNVTYEVSPTYTVTIPQSVTISSDTKTTTATISAENVVVANGKQVQVALTDTTKTTGGESFALQTTEGAEITYTVTKGDNTNVSIGDAVLQVNPKDADNGSATLTLTAPNSVTYAGTYTGTMTFTISLVDVTTA